MPLRSFVIAVVLLALSTLACSLAGGAPSASPSTSTEAPTATTPPIAPTRNSVTPTAIDMIAIPTPTGTITSSGTLTGTITPTSTLAVTTAPTISPRSTGPLDFQVLLVGCRRDSSREGGVILTFKVEATGGNGVYTYIREGQVVPQLSERPATKGNAVIDAWRVRSGDGQEVEKKFRFTGKEFGCP
jgi:hypothetical protein